MKFFRLFSVFVILAMLSSLGYVPVSATAPEAKIYPAEPVSLPASPATEVVSNTITILHTNDFHGNLQLSGSNPGMARVAQKVEDVKTAVGAENVILLDVGDEMQGTLLSNLFHGESTIDIFNQVGYAAATFGNHEFDWGQTVLMSRTTEAVYPYVTANIVVDDTGDCATAGWEVPAFADSAWITKTVGAPGNEVTLGIIGVTSQETPYITVDWATEGLCFKDPAASISHYWADLDAASDAIVVLSHLGFNDGGYGYGFTVYGDKTLAQKLIDAGTPVDLILGGHSHTDISAPAIIGNTTVVQAHYAGRKVGKATLMVDQDTGEVGITWEKIVVGTGDPEYGPIVDAINVWANDPWYLGEINRVVGFTNVPIVRNYNGDSLMGSFVNDAIYYDLNTDAEPLNDVDMVFNNAGGLRADIIFEPPPTTTLPFTLTHGLLYSVLPFGNATVVGDMTGAQVIDLLNQSATLFKGALQVAGIQYDFYRYTDALPGPQPWAWGAFNIEVWDKVDEVWEPIDPAATYRIATNEFLAPAGQDGFTPFKYVTNISYWGDMLDGVERWVAAAYPYETPYDGVLDGRITRDGDDSTGSVVPVTILHNNDPHGRLVEGSYEGLTNLATLVAQERAHNPDRNLLLNAGDVIQGDSMSFYFKTAPFGYTADGTPIITPTMHIQPSILAMNTLGYDAMTLGNHEFNFGSHIFTGVLGLAEFPILGANVTDTGEYGLAEIPVEPSTQVVLPGPDGDIEIGILGITNHRVPNYELPSNIPGLTFTNPISAAMDLEGGLADANDAVIALTHIGFTENPSSVEVDTNVDTYLAEMTDQIDAIIGGHSHTNPKSGFGPYKYLPAILPTADSDPVLVTQAYRYNDYLGEVIIGFMPDGLGGYDVVTRVGRYIDVTKSTDPTNPTVEDPVLKALMAPYVAMLNAYNNTELGVTTVPLDAMNAFTEETNAANLQADASVAVIEETGVEVDFHLSGATTNAKIADTATVTDPVTVTVSNMFTLVPYENSLLVISMNGPQIKAVLERAYRNYFYYKYVPGYGGYSHYTTCMLDTNAGVEITYADYYPALPNGNNVRSLTVNGVPVDFADADTFYNVSTVNYLAAGSCNFNDDGVSLWPLDQIVADTQLYVREASIKYVADQGIVSPTVEGRLVFNYMMYTVQLPVVLKAPAAP